MSGAAAQPLRGALERRFAVWVRARQGEDLLPVRLRGGRLYVLPTRAGFGFGALLLLMLIAALNYGNSLALFLTFLLAGFALVAMQQCHRNLLGLRVVSAVTEAAFAHGTAAVRIELENPSALARWRIAAGSRGAPTAAIDLPPGALRSLRLPVPVGARGVLTLDRVRIATQHPFGLFVAWTWLHLPLEIIVYPQPRGSLPMPAESGPRQGARTPGASGSDEWRGLRPFRDGDSPRQVAWKAYAREAPLLVKEYDAYGGELRRLNFERLRDLPLEARLEQLARWVVDAETSGDRYGLELPAVRLGFDRGSRHRQRCLTALAVHDLERKRAAPVA